MSEAVKILRETLIKLEREGIKRGLECTHVYENRYPLLICMICGKVVKVKP